ncbi:damage-inducible protein CinA [Acidihalobacter yilgarnensis]|uniref:Damage-inducible protein CinA n=1 Tax=Acidihalobacter yilgarnensis TaxID=2819280 RepID=A0A1D8ITI2_9GAMM|nr:nicotinamide-nucleotide amidohydrolase family protein [Acidihalobacter yilgarnensis]AOU99733.1 damage-inducible protein CinA [Acidihalobacter yilgarnensis]
MSGDGMALAERLGRVLATRGMKLVTAESCTGGWIAKRITDIAGSSAWFEIGYVTYSNDAKHKLLGVSERVFETAGAVSASCVREMAVGALVRGGGDIAVAVSGIAGPGGGSPEKPVGTVWFGYALVDGTIEAESGFFRGDRDAIRRAAVDCALRGLLTRVEN